MDQFEGKVAVITGAANPRGIGFAAGRRFAGLGCKVVLADTIVDAIARDTFWAHPTVDDERLAGGRQRPVIEWENELYRRRCAALVERTAPDPISGARATSWDDA